jgi:hypothetical protein
MSFSLMSLDLSFQVHLTTLEIGAVVLPFRAFSPEEEKLYQLCRQALESALESLREQLTSQQLLLDL